MASERMAAALELADDLLTKIELSDIGGPEQLKMASRLARLLDDADAINWLRHEITGYLGHISDDSSDHLAAARSGRIRIDSSTGDVEYATATVTVLVARLKTLEQQQAVTDSYNERVRMRQAVESSVELLDRVLGNVHQYVADKHTELRFGAAVETAFATVRNEVDARITELAPSAGLKFASAFENAASDSPEDWANAAGACRRLIKAVADELRPPGEPVGKISMTDDKYINRLIDWISNQQSLGGTSKEVVARDLEHLGTRLDAFTDAGNKGAHAEVTKYEASRFITGTYLLIGDILKIIDASKEPTMTG